MGDPQVANILCKYMFRLTVTIDNHLQIRAAEKLLIKNDILRGGNQGLNDILIDERKKTKKRSRLIIRQRSS
jgi:hypothetical protein